MNSENQNLEVEDKKIDRRIFKIHLIITILISFTFINIFNIIPIKVEEKQILLYEQKAEELYSSLDTVEGKNKKISTVIDGIEYTCNVDECKVSIDRTSEYIGRVEFLKGSSKFKREYNILPKIFSCIFIVAISFIISIIITPTVYFFILIFLQRLKI